MPATPELYKIYKNLEKFQGVEILEQTMSTAMRRRELRGLSGQKAIKQCVETNCYPFWVTLFSARYQ